MNNPTEPSGVTPTNALHLLEAWLNEHKNRAVEISHDNGYGAACWEVILYRGLQKVVCNEVAFMEGPARVEKDGNLWIYMPGDEWHGLEATILFALETARECFK